MPPRREKGGAGGRAGGGRGGGGGRNGGASHEVQEQPSYSSGAAQAVAPPQMSVSVSQNIPLPLRPNFGSVGVKVQLRANHFALTSTKPAVLRYHVEVKAPPRAPTAGPSKERERPRANKEPLGLPSGLCRAALHKLSTSLGWKDSWAYDGQHALFGAVPLTEDRGGDEKTFTVPLPSSRGGMEEFTVSIRLLGSFPLQEALRAFFSQRGAALPWDALACLDAVQRHRRSLDSNWLTVGRNFLNSRDVKPLVGGGLEIWNGYSASARVSGDATSGALALVVDRAAAAFVCAQPVLELIKAVVGANDQQLRGQPMPPQAHRMASKALRGVKVEMRITTASGTTKRSYRVKGLTATPANKSMFDNEALGRKQSVAEYYATQKGTTLQYANLPCLDVSLTKSRPVWVPAELCHVISGQRRQLVEDPMASAAMIKMTATRPGDRRALIENAAKSHVDQDPTMRSFGISVKPEMTAVEGRVLPTPTVEYKGNNYVDIQARSGSWNLRGAKLLQPAPAPKSWAVVCLDERRVADVRAFLPDFIATMGNTAGIALPGQPTIVTVGQREALEDTLQRAFGGRPTPDLTFALVVLPDSSSDTYMRIKSVLDEKLGVVSQCMLSKHLRSKQGPKPDPQYLGNVALKVNAKLGGINSQLKMAKTLPSSPAPVRIVGVSEVPTMLFGADVTHPAPGSSANSIAAVVGSLDAVSGRYACRLSIQNSRQEIISDLDVLTQELLVQFERATGGRRPERVVFFRDGVSEGQFQLVLRDELPLLQRAFQRMGDGSYRPKLTFIMVQKRHHTRLFVNNPADADRSGNVPPGTVVDRGIVHPHEHDFFLMSHAGLQGTSRPVHYHVLLDKNAYGADVLQTMCFQLSHTYCRCTRSVSLVAPVHYAHLAAFRGRVLRGGDGSDSGSVTSGGAGAAGAQKLDVHAKLQNSMYFC